MKLGHYYHVYAAGNWEGIVVDHFHAVRASGLMDELDFIRVGIVGPADRRVQVKDVLPFAEVVVEAEDGWEQVTLDALHLHTLKETGPAGILYAHTKAAYQGDPLRHTWRHSMTYDTVYNWKYAVSLLARKDAVGPFYMSSDRPEHVGHKSFFGGNFWWATAQYLRGLPRIKREHRFQAEGWVGLNDPDVANLRDGPPMFGNFHL